VSGEQHHIIVEKRSNTAAIVSISLAILGFVFSLVPFLGWFLLPIWVMAILFGIVGLFKSYRRGLAISGIAIGLMTFMYKILFLQALFGG
jgi:hydrogenase/urease accessory protein HupE